MLNNTHFVLYIFYYFFLQNVLLNKYLYRSINWRLELTFKNKYCCYFIKKTAICWYENIIYYFMTKKCSLHLISWVYIMQIGRYFKDTQYDTHIIWTISVAWLDYSLSVMSVSFSLNGKDKLNQKLQKAD